MFFHIHITLLSLVVFPLRKYILKVQQHLNINLPKNKNKLLKTLEQQ